MGDIPASYVSLPEGNRFHSHPLIQQGQNETPLVPGMTVDPNDASPLLPLMAMIRQGGGWRGWGMSRWTQMGSGEQDFINFR